MTRNPMRHLRRIMGVASATEGGVRQPTAADARGKSATCLQGETKAPSGTGGLGSAPRQIEDDAPQLWDGDAALHADDLDPDEAASPVHVDQHPVLHFPGAGGARVLELDIQGVRLRIVTDFHEATSCQ